MNQPSPPSPATLPLTALPEPARQVLDYWIDGWQRTILFWDVLRRRSTGYYEQRAKAVPHVLSFDAELVLDARTFARPANYLLVRIQPPDGLRVDPKKRPFVVVDPRAGHGPGIGGFKVDSELGVAMRAGHPAYFVGFTPEPMPGQTIEDIMRAEAVFLEQVIALHPEADGKPCVIGNCQAGWAVMMLAAVRPELFGPLIIPGSPLSYWAGVEGENPMRYTGGVLGGSWLTALTSDLGGGKFDGGHLVNNFEALNPSNTYWSKNYNLWSKVDTEAERFLEFEKWWGGHVSLNAEEIQWIVDQLFIGNRLATGEIVTSDGQRIDLRNIRSPIVVFCSKGDNITPPAQALGWICDLYDHVDDIRTRGQTIVYAIHDSIGHLGIFVSGKIAKKEHEEFASNIDFIDVLPPGLYEAEITEHAGERGENPYLIRFAGRTIGDVRAIVKPDPENERRFATVRRLSEANLAFYRTLMQPFVRAMVTPPVAEAIRQTQPLRMSYGLFSDRNPFMLPVAMWAEMIRAHRQPATKGNVFHGIESDVSEQIVRALGGAAQARDTAAERFFERFYSQPTLQGLAGLQPGETPRRHPGTSRDHQILVAERIAELKAAIDQGGPYEAVLRAILYIGLAGRVADERAFETLRQLLAEEGADTTVSEFKTDVRRQFLMLLLDEDAALAALPKLLAGDRETIAERLEEVRRVVSATGQPSGVRLERLARIEVLFAAAGDVRPQSPPEPGRARRKVTQ